MGPRSHGRLIVFIGLLWLLLAAALLAYRQLSPPRVEITWETATEQNTAGFTLLRSQERGGQFSVLPEGEFIESEGGPTSGASYGFVDNEVVPGNTYYYVLEEIEADGSRQRYMDDLFEYEVPHNPYWLLGLALLCAVIGVALLIGGWKETRQT